MTLNEYVLRSFDELRSLRRIEQVDRSIQGIASILRDSGLSTGEQVQFWAKLYKELRDKGTLVVLRERVPGVSPYAVVDHALESIQVMSKRVGETVE